MDDSRSKQTSSRFHYKLCNSVVVRFRDHAVIPFYVDWRHISELLDAVEFVKTWRRNISTHDGAWGNRLDYAESYCRGVLAASRRSASNNQGSTSAIIERLMSLGVISSMSSVEARSEYSNNTPLFLPVERFYRGGNHGSGRHAYIGSLEFKGTGQTPCAVRRDYHHRWGGLPFDTALHEIVCANHASSASPQGAVPMIFGAFFAIDHRPALVRYADDSVGYHLLAVTARMTDYLRIANIYTGPDAIAIGSQVVGPVNDLIDQSAALSAYGHFQLEPTEDNLTLTGTLLDLTESIISPLGPIPVLHNRTLPDGGYEVSMPDLIESIEKDPRPLHHFSSAAAQLKAIQLISSFRKDIGMSDLFESWLRKFPERIAYYWLIRQGYSPEISEHQCTEAACYFASHTDLSCTSKKSYLRNRDFRRPRPNELGGQRIQLFLDATAESALQPLDEAMRRHPHSRLTRAYNNRPLNIANAREHAGLLLSTVLEARARLRRVIADYVLTGRVHNPFSHEHRVTPLIATRNKDRLRIESPALMSAIRIITSAQDHLHLVYSILDTSGSLCRGRTSATQTSDGILASGLPKGELMLEGLEIGPDPKTAEVVLIPTTLCSIGESCAT